MELLKLLFLGMAPHKDGDWKQVLVLDGNKTHVLCRHCNTKVGKKIERIRTHLDKYCSNFKRPVPTEKRQHENTGQPDPVKRLCTEEIAIAGMSTDPVTPSRQPPATQSRLKFSSVTPQPQDDDMDEFAFDFDDPVVEVTKSPYRAAIKQKVQMPIMKCSVLTTSKKDQAQCETAWAEFIYANAIAFNCTETAAYKKLNETLRPGFKGPGRKKLANSLLDERHQVLEDTLLAEMTSDSVTATISIDGWSNIKNEPIVATCVYTGKATHLLDTIDTGSIRKGSDYIAKVSIKAIKDFEKKYGVDVRNIYFKVPYQHSQYSI